MGEAQISRGVAALRRRTQRAPPAGLPADRRVVLAAGVVALAALYRGAAELGYALQFAGPVAAVVWLPVGVGTAFLYLGGLRFWPGVLLGDLVANDYSALPLGAAVGQSVGNLLEVVVATLLLRRLVPRGDPLGTVRGVGSMLLAIAAGTALSATIGCLSLLLGGVLDAGALPRAWRTWALGDASGALIVLPLALAWVGPPPGRRGEPARLALALAGVAAVSAVALSSRGAFIYPIFAALVWAALRFGRRGATAAVAVAAAFAIWEGTRREGPFAFESATGSVLSTQLFIAVAAITTLCVAAVVAEREALAEGLLASRARLVESAADERRRIERDLHDGVQQRLTALLVRLQLATDRTPEGPAGAALGAARGEVTAAIDELRDLAHGIHPSIVTDLGLTGALRGIAAGSVLPVHLRDLPARRVDTTAEVTAYFVIAEAVTNARKHAHATAVDISVTTRDDVLRIEITDDGVGGARQATGSGIQGLRDRVEAIGGSFSIASPRGRGTRIVAELPAGSPSV